MKRWLFPLLLPCWLAVSPLSAVAEESPQAGDTNWSLVREHANGGRGDEKYDTKKVEKLHQISGLSH